MHPSSQAAYSSDPLELSLWIVLPASKHFTVYIGFLRSIMWILPERSETAMIEGAWTWTMSVTEISLGWWNSLFILVVSIQCTPYPCGATNAYWLLSLRNSKFIMLLNDSNCPITVPLFKLETNTLPSMHPVKTILFPVTIADISSLWNYPFPLMIYPVLGVMILSLFSPAATICLPLSQNAKMVGGKSSVYEV